MRYKRWISQIDGTLHFTPIPPSMADEIGVSGDEVPIEIVTAGEDWEIWHPVGCQAAGVMKRRIHGS